MRAATLYEALAVLRMVKDLPPGAKFPNGEWMRVHRVHSDLQFELMQAGLQVPVEPVKAAEVAHG